MGKGGGGHGGLNILPQKSWNVYNWDNRDKVAADEEKLAAEEKEAYEQKLQADRQARREKLFAQAQLRISAEEGEAVSVEALEQKHVNLFAEAEEAALRAEQEAIKATNSSRAGIGARSEEALDKAQHQLGYGCHPSSSGKLPWYAAAESSLYHKTDSDTLPARIRKEKEQERLLQARSTSSADPASGDKGGAPLALKAPPVPALPAGTGGAKLLLQSSKVEDKKHDSSSSEDSDDSSERTRKRKRSKEHKHSKQKDKKKRKERRKEKEKYLEGLAKQVKEQRKEQLRAERLARERAEQTREARLVYAKEGFGPGAPSRSAPQEGKKYNAGYGYSKKR